MNGGAGIDLRGSGSPVVSGGSVYVGMAGGRLLALRTDNGGLVWDASVTVPAVARNCSAWPISTAIRSCSVVACSWRRTRARWPHSNRVAGVAWRRKLSSYSRMAADRRVCGVGDADGVVWGLDPAPRRGALEPGRTPSIAGCRMSRWSMAWSSLVISRATCIGWITRTVVCGVRTRAGSDPITTGMQVVGGVLYVQGDGGELTAVRLPSR